MLMISLEEFEEMYISQNDAEDNLYLIDVYKNPEAKCKHNKQFFCKACYSALTESQKKMLEGISA